MGEDKRGSRIAQHYACPRSASNPTKTPHRSLRKLARARARAPARRRQMQACLLARTVVPGVTCVHGCGPPRLGQAGRAPAFPRLRMPAGLRPGPPPGLARPMSMHAVPSQSLGQGVG
jgi:hypothetical protein